MSHQASHGQYAEVSGTVDPFLLIHLYFLKANTNIMLLDLD